MATGIGTLTLSEVTVSGNGNRNLTGTGTLTLSVVTVCFGAEITTQMPVSADFLECSDDLYFQFLENPLYDQDRTLFKNLQAEAINIYGETIIWYKVTWDTNYDPIFGEDDDRRVERKFPVKASFELPKELEQIARFGVEGLDNFRMEISKEHFKEVSKWDGTINGFFPSTVDCDIRTSAYDSVLPKPGDIIRTPYNDKYYEVLDVGEEENIFLQEKHSWVIIVRTLIRDNITLSPLTSSTMSEISSAVLDTGDIWKHNDIITSADNSVLFNDDSETNTTNQDPLGGW